MNPCRTAPALLAALAACGSAPEPRPIVPPELDSGVRYFAGTVLSGPIPDPAIADRIDPADALQVQCTVRYVADVHGLALAPVATRTALIVSAAGDDPLLPASDLAVGAHVGMDEASTRYAESLAAAVPSVAVPLVELDAVLPIGVTAAFYAQSVNAVVTERGEVVRKLASVLVGREPDTGEVTAALLLEDLGPERTRLGVAQLDQREVLKRDLVVLQDAPRAGGPPLVVVLPSPFDLDRDEGFVVVIALAAPGSGAAQEAAVARCADELRRAAEDGAGTRLALDRHERLSLALRSSLRTLELAEDHRSVLVFLAGTTSDAPLALDLALSGDAATLAAWAQLVGTATGEATGAAPVAADGDLAWTLERTAYQLLIGRLDRGELSPAGLGALSRHAGEAGTFPGAIAGILERTSNADEFADAVVRENLGFLDSPDPAARVRAYDWLASHGRAPADYDPLADRAARRRAMDAFHAAEEDR